MAHIVFQNNLLIADYNVLSMQNMAKYSKEDFFLQGTLKSVQFPPIWLTPICPAENECH